jgi:hypothetical protein
MIANECKCRQCEPRGPGAPRYVGSASPEATLAFLVVLLVFVAGFFAGVLAVP